MAETVSQEKLVRGEVRQEMSSWTSQDSTSSLSELGIIVGFPTEEDII